MEKTKSHPESERHLTSQELADRERVPLATVRAWRFHGNGPRGMTIGKHVRYRLSDVVAWEESRVDQRSRVR